MRLLLLLPAPFLLSGCITSVVKEVVTAPVKVVSKTADVLTTSQSEADEKRGRALRQKEENLGKLSRYRDKAQKKCDDGSDKACREAQELEQQIEAEQDRAI
ncbi:MAG: hypothetical protein HC843_11275 [Sphingomonadales bacterium]|nr:hypothetical protein [Sphingomonadales bacterium]